MSDNGLPKATMANFIKQRISDKRKVSAEFTALLLDLSKQFIDKVSAKANQICESENKKTINNDHFFSALRELEIGDVIGKLQKIDQTIKMKQKKRQQQKQRVQQNVRTMIKRQSEMEDQKKKEKAPIYEHKSNYKPIELNDDEPDFVQILEQEDHEMEDQDDEEVEVKIVKHKKKS